MKKYFKNVNSFEDLKAQYKELLKTNHPDNGGDLEIMKEINVQFDALFPIWKNKKEQKTGETVTETATSTRREFYTSCGWEGENYTYGMTLKEIAQIVRTYIKEKYPTYKFSVRTSYASTCQELHVELKESPIQIYKNFEEMDYNDFEIIAKRLFVWDTNGMIDFLNSPIEEKKKVIETSNNSYKNVLNEITKMVVKDVDAFVKSYNYDDSDSMIDYFDTNFYYFGCLNDNGRNVKIVPKTARIKNKKTSPATKQTEEKQTETQQLEGYTKYTYTITKGEDTRDGSELWIVRIVESLDKTEYIAENKKMRERGGYYSKFLHGFLFRFDPSEILINRAA